MPHRKIRSRERCSRETMQAYGRVDILVNNAGVATHINTEEISLKYWREVLDINITAAFLCSREAIKIMKDQKPQGGRIINMGSISAKRRGLDSLPYTTDQVRHPGDDPPAHHGRPQVRRRGVDHSSRLDAERLHHPPWPQPSPDPAKARGLRDGRRGRRRQGRDADGP